MKLVELCGPSGVGKSTIYNTMLEFGPCAFVPNPKPPHREVMEIVREGVQRYEDIKAFTYLLRIIFSTARGARVRVREKHTYRSLSKLIRCRMSSSPEVMVVDGGLCQRGQAIDALRSEISVGHYYREMPAPDLVVMVDAHVHTIKERNRGRGGSHDRSADVIRSRLVYDVAREEFTKRQIPMLSINSELAAVHNALVILEACNGLKTGEARAVLS